MTTERTLLRIERSIMAVALTSVAILAFAAFTAPARSSGMGEPTCPKGKVLFSIMDTDGTYKPICIPAGAGQ